MEKLIFNLEINCGTRGRHDKDESSEKSGPFLSKMKFQG